MIEIKKRGIKKLDIDKAIEINIHNTNEFSLISNKLLALLKEWDSLTILMFSMYLGYPYHIIKDILKILESLKKVQELNGVWSLL